MKNLFKKNNVEEAINRINQLNKDSQPKWGKMSVSQMFAHCSVAYESVYEDKHTPPKGLKKKLLIWFIKPIVVSEKPFKPNGRTAPQFLISDERDFEKEKTRLTEYLKRTQELGEAHFDNKESHSFGKLNKTEWNNLFSKHLDHHLNQFGV